MPSGTEIFVFACLVVCAVLFLGGGKDTKTTTTQDAGGGGARKTSVCTPTPGTYCPSGQSQPQPCPVGFYCPGQK